MQDTESDTDVRTAVLTAAADALDAHSRDTTGSAGYNRRRAYEAGFDAAMAELRDVPLDERPDGLVAEVDELVAHIRDRDHTKETVAQLIRDAIDA